MLDRRSFIKSLIAAGTASTVLDKVDRLLWIPEKTIFIPPLIEKLSSPEIIALEPERIRLLIPKLFERDDYFFKMIESRDVKEMSTRSTKMFYNIKI